MNAPAASSFSFEPLFLALAIGAVYGYMRLAKTVERPSRGRAALFVFGISNAIRRWGIQLGVTGLGLAIFLGSVIQLGRITWG